MANSLGVTCMKTITLIINLIFVLTGILLIALGAYAYVEGVEGLSSVIISAGVITLGCLVFLVSFLGCCGAAKESRCMLMTYAIFILIFVLLELALGITAYVKRDSIPEFADTNWSRLYDTERQAIDDLEHAFKCCGWHSQTDRAVPPWNDTDAQQCITFYPEFASEFCSAKINQAIEDSMLFAGITAICIAVVQLICLLFSCCLFAQLPSQKQKEEALLDEARRLNREGVSQNYQSNNQQQKY